ncbi:2-C-methyl-D-erythritol 2,4-cyclodiphosphate synthase [Allobaculum mucilyticum]|uniref:2-C-methyl-D-erythritol 2,4-cyclodiphosphate synthase n=1 Tax=Allobaculum mucilyticum TaxID=2834459 RepID=UPI001E450AD8|nr:2-C-methyl-D-erythritol 2,4-cyclodiphosphate synthase [Allobaculum mucilyticum]UNT95383.1 2-C-methyl-D-erythritol 2,4-cyclodiphosphate synthase [Allobaculum mucilyticum]
MAKLRIGQSVDIHPLQEGRPLILGGVQIDSPKGLKGHSDADVLLHAIAEGILGALALGDLGAHFPDTDPAYKGIASTLLLDWVYRLMHEQGYHVGNIDATVLAEKPKLAGYILQMRENIASLLHCDLDCVSVKATRGEKLGFVGRQEGMTAICVCLLEENEA